MTEEKKNKNENDINQETPETEVSAEVESENSIESDDTKVEVIKETEKVEKPVEVKLSPEERLQEKVDQLEDKLIRRAAEFENYKKRTARQFDDIIQPANDRIINDFLEVLDNFKRSFDHDNGEQNNIAFQEGVKLIYNQMNNLFEKYQVKPIEAIGQPFNPNFHEAMMQVESDEFEEGTVAMEMNPGYKIGDRVIRHSRVGVAIPKSESPEEQKEEPSDEKENNSK